MSDHIAVMKDGQIVETGVADEVYEHPKHEYTRALTAVPVPDPKRMQERRVERRKLKHVLAET